MKLAHAKQIPLEQFLAKLGHDPVRRRQSQLWYLSPLRSEKTPSFKVNTDLNLWMDFGAGEGGTIIDFAMEYGKHASIPAALRLIETTMGGLAAEREDRPLPSRHEKQAKIELRYTGSLKNLSLKRYLTQRGLNPRRCAADIREVQYTAHGRNYTAIGFANDLGGYELRNRTFKGTLGSKAISTRSGKDATNALVFEGFFDYLTYLMLWGKPLGQVLVLNSVALRERAAEYLSKEQVARIELFRDNDAAGEALLTYFQNQLPAVEIIDQSHLYRLHNDLNEWHQANRQ